MEQNYQWGDHMVLKAIADALNLVVVVFNVYEDDIRRTEILSEGRPITKRQKLTIFLGHIGEFHYLSLRPLHWEKEWPYSKLFIIACFYDLYIDKLGYKFCRTKVKFQKMLLHFRITYSTFTSELSDRKQSNINGMDRGKNRS